MMLSARMSRHGAEWWAERLKEMAETGDADGIARRYGVRPKTLLWWRSELRRRGHQPSHAATRLLPVVVAHTPARSAPASSDVEMVVEIGPMRMTMRGSVTAEHLAALVAASAKAC
jgi:hypothetical protein